MHIYIHTRGGGGGGGNFCALNFWPTLRPLIAWLLLLFVVFLIGGGGEGVGVGVEGAREEKIKAKPGREKIREQT